MKRTKRFLMTLALLLTAVSGAWAEELTVYDGTAKNGYVPLYGFYADAYLKCEYVMPASQLSQMEGAAINAMKFYTSEASVSWGNAYFQVFMKEVSETTLDGFTGIDDATIVYQGKLEVTESTMTVNFTTPYTYNGGNLLIGFYNIIEGSYVTATFTGETVNGASVQGYSYSDLGSISPGQRNFIPKTTFTYEATGPKVTIDNTLEQPTATFDMQQYDVTATYALKRDMSVDMPVTVGDGTEGYRIHLKKNKEGKFEPAEMTAAEMRNLITVHDDIEDADLTAITDYTVKIFAVDDEDQPTGDAIAFTALEPGRYVAKATAADGSNYSGESELSNVFQLLQAYEVTVGAGEYVTYYCDEALYVEDEGAQLYTITEVGTETATATQIPSANAEMPFLVYNTTDEVKTFLLIPTDDVINQAVAPEFRGTSKDTTFTAADLRTDDFYVCSGTQFAWVKKAGKLAANRCWLQLDKEGDAARTLRIVFSGEATGVKDVKEVKEVNADSFYDLNGRKVSTPKRKGVYIQNGQKVVIK